MAHPILHFSIGLGLGSLALMRPLRDKLRAGTPVATTMAHRLIGSYVIGLYAVVPGLLSWIGIPDVFCQGWWMNVFLFSHLIDRFKSGGALTGTVLALMCFAFQYAVLLAAIVRTRPGALNSTTPDSEQRSRRGTA